jgi:transcriptional regulator with XRE-family HTH domain
MSINQLIEKIVNSAFSQTDEFQIPPPELVGFFVRWARGLRQWKQNTLANFANVSLPTVERVERGEHVSGESLDKIGGALGFAAGYLTAPRRPLSREETVTNFVETYGEMEPVSVRPLDTQSQVRQLAGCHSYLLHRPDLGPDYDAMIGELVEWIDLASFVLSPLIQHPQANEGRRRDPYNGVLTSVRELERHCATVLCWDSARSSR